MKTTYLKITAGILLLAGLTISCDGCNDKKATGTNSDEVNATVETTDGSTTYEASSDSDASGNGNSGTKSSGSAASVTSGTSKTSKTTKKGNGYSAPDGTDAENHDGDMYTKHDTTPQASGPPIK